MHHYPHQLISNFHSAEESARQEEAAVKMTGENFERLAPEIKPLIFTLCEKYYY